MASNPRAIPRSGPRKLMKTVNEGMVPSVMVNSFRKKKVPSGSLGFTAWEKFARAVYSDPKEVRAIMAMRMTNLQLRIWSAISFSTITPNGCIILSPVREDFDFIDKTALLMIHSSFKIAEIDIIKAVILSF
jgi:hypothetical protein